MTTLHVFTADDEEWVIAESPEDAAIVYVEYIGGESDIDASQWEAIPDEKPLTLRVECQETHRTGVKCVVCNGEDIIRETLTCAEWCTKQGRGHWGSASA